MKTNRTGALVVGTILVVLGILLLVVQVADWGDWAGWDKIWPIFPLGFGLLFLAAYFTGGLRDGGLAFSGTGFILSGAFLFGFTLTPPQWEWSEMSKLWPVFPLIWGFAFVVSFVAERRKARDWGALGFGLVAMVVGAVGLAYYYTSYIGENIIKLWPLLIVALGVFGLIAGLARAVQRK
jgi:peptidoglycan/LPS O-acetylase OafA/YrhL